MMSIQGMQQTGHAGQDGRRSGKTSTTEYALALVAAVASAARDAVRDADDLRRLQQSLIAILPPAEEEA
jgi:hypothetical protein